MEIQLVSFCLTAVILLLSLSWFLRSKTKVINYWPVVGALPSLLLNMNCWPEWVTEVFSSLGGGSFFIYGGVFSNITCLVTCDPKNLLHILKTNSTNFHKGSDFKEIFDKFGDGVFAADNESWRLHRKLAHACLSSVEFRNFVSKVGNNILEDHLVPFLTHAAKQGSVVDLQDVCKRFSFDYFMRITYGKDQNSLSTDLETNELAEVFDDLQDALSYRLVMPMFFWKLLRLLNLGSEKKVAKARKLEVNQGEQISLKRENLLKGIETNDLSSTILKSGEESCKDDKFIRDSIFNLFIGGRDTTASGLSWFWSVANSPRVEAKIVEELTLVFMMKNKNEDESVLSTKSPWVFDSDDLKGLVYLHATICESLRLFPPVPFSVRCAIKEDVLPDGSVVKPGLQIILAHYSQGKMPCIWGEDSLEFKPERWIDDEGKLNNEPLSKFLTFSVGPRTCLGKNMAFTQMKAVAAAVLFNFQVEIMDGHPFASRPSIILFMDELLVKVTQRNA